MTPPRADGMIQARRRDSDTKRARVRTTVQHMLEHRTPITFAAVARQARVSTWLVYAPGIREAIDDARARQHTSTTTQTHHEPTHGIEVDLALARAEITRLRAERDQQRQQLQRALGTRLDDLAKTDLKARVDELTRSNTELAATAKQHQADNEALRTRITELEDDLAATRTSLRRMIRTENRPTDT